HVLDGAGSYDEAADHVRKGNALCRALWEKQGKSYELQAHARMVDSLMEGFGPEFFGRVKGFGAETETPIFVVGLPRSGTTLTEQILASHSQVYGAGELNFARDDFEWLPTVVGQQITSIECFPLLTREAANHIAQWHL